MEAITGRVDGKPSPPDVDLPGEGKP
jgi:hypothetical protein